MPCVPLPYLKFAPLSNGGAWTRLLPSEFYDILKMKALPGYNIGYADKNDTIFYISNGLIPKRAEGYNWKEVVPEIRVKRCGPKPMPSKNYHRSFNLALVISTTPTTVRFTLPMKPTTPKRKTIQKTATLKPTTTTVQRA